MKVGILGGGCFWKTWDLPFEQIEVNTPYGNPSDSLCYGVIGKHEVYTLQRHGKNYQLSPEKIPYQANTYALHTLNTDFVIEITSSGSLRDTDENGDIALFDQIIDYTRKRPDSLFEPVITKYTNIDFSSPVSEVLLNFAHQIFNKNGVKHHFRGTLITEDGPRFSTLSESKMYKAFGADFINQTSCPSLYFLRELNIPVLGLTMITNKVGLKKDCKILSNDISNSIVKHGYKVAEALKKLIENLPDDIELENYRNDAYDVSAFTLRK